jgi:hypothetical protein
MITRLLKLSKKIYRRIYFSAKINRLSIPRFWGNFELRKFANLFTGKIIHVSAYNDEDKEGNKYESYFINAESYNISNYKTAFKGYQGLKNEISLDLTADLKESFIGKFDVVFNHTTLEHIFEVRKAFKNLCLLSKDIVIIIVPFIHQMHSEKLDFWRFTPLAIKKLFEQNNYDLIYISFNHHKKSNVYIFAIGSKFSKKWQDKIGNEFHYKIKGAFIGSNAITYSRFTRINLWINRWITKLYRIIPIGTIIKQRFNFLIEKS